MISATYIKQIKLVKNMYLNDTFNTVKRKQFFMFALQYLLILVISIVLSVIMPQVLAQKELGFFLSAAEFVCIFIALSSFFVVWYTHSYNTHSNRIIGYGFLSVALFDIHQTYSHPAYELFSNEKSSLFLGYWIFGRIMEALVIILSSTRLFRTNLNKWVSTITTVLISSVLIIVFKTFVTLPAFYVDSYPILLMKIINICLVILLIVCFQRIHKRINKRDFITYRHVCMAVLIAIPAILNFTLFSAASLHCTTLGNILKISYYYFLFKGVFASSVTYPFEKNKINKEKLNQSRNELKEILANLPVAIITSNNNGKITFANKNAFELIDIKYNHDTRNETEEINSAVMDDIGNLCFNFLNTKKWKSSCAKKYRIANLRTINLNINMFRNKYGVMVTLHDTAKEQQLDDVQLQTSTILNSLSNLVLIFDKNLNIIMFNKALTECVELEFEDIIGRNINYLIRNLSFHIDNKPFKATPDNIVSEISYEASFVTPNGIKKYIIFHSNSILNIDSNVIGYIFVASDITEYKKEQEKIQHQDKLAIIGQMGAGIVHETKNHLASIKGYCQLLSHKSTDDSFKKYIDRIENITSDLNRVVMDFLTLTKPTETTMDIYSLNEIIESMRYMLESPSFMKGVKIDIELSDNSEDDIRADESQIKQIILNMSKNAIEAMSDTDNPRLKIETRSIKSLNKIQLIISDNGKGISEEDLKNLGTPFFTTKETGTGLGLSMCYRIIKDHGGTIDVKSEIGKGTTFIITFNCFEDSCEEYKKCSTKVS